jgi:hypothetical protein
MSKEDIELFEKCKNEIINEALFKISKLPHDIEVLNLHIEAFNEAIDRIKSRR